MGSSEPVNREAVRLYLEGAKSAIRSAHYNLDGGFHGVAVNRAYYAFFYVATALLLTEDVSRRKHSGVLAAFREHFVKSSRFPIQHSYDYGEAFELRNVTDYEMLGKASEMQARAVVENAERLIERCVAYLGAEGYL